MSLIYPAPIYKSSVLSGGPDSERREAIVKSERPAGLAVLKFLCMLCLMRSMCRTHAKAGSEVGYLQCFQELSFAVMILSRCEGDLPAPTGTGFGYGEKSSVCP